MGTFRSRMMCSWHHCGCVAGILLLVRARGLVVHGYEAKNCVQPMEGIVGDNGETADQALGKSDGADCRKTAVLQQ